VSGPWIVEHDAEQSPGLPGRLPEGEAILWQGAPAWRSFARYGFHLPQLGLYFGLLLAWYVAESLAAGTAAWTVLVGTARLAGLAAAALALLTGLAALVARTTLYTITTRRVVMRVGMALPITLNLPFRLIDAASVRLRADRSGDIALTMAPGHRVAFVTLWPHVRPWRLARPMPMLRALPDAERAAAVLGRALALRAYAPERAAAAPAQAVAA
jgi:hypothetical protein